MNRRINILSFLSFLAITALVLLLSACRQSKTDAVAPEAAPRLPTGDNFTVAPCLMDTPFGYKVTCGTVEAPLDYAQRDGAKIKLAVAIARTKSLTPASDPILFLPQNPSRSSLNRMDFTVPNLGPFLQDRDIIFYDLRGVGHSEPALAECDDLEGATFQALGEGLDRDKVFLALVDAYQRCRDRVQAEGVDLTKFTFEQHVADLNTLRAALGYPEVNLLGSGFGYELALRLVQESSQGIRSAAFISAEDLTGMRQQGASGLQQALNKIFQACRASDKCKAAYPELEQEFYRTIDQLNLEPSPIQIRQRGEETGFELNLSGGVLLEMTRMLLDSREGLASFPGVIHEVQQDRTATLDEAVMRIAYQRGFGQPAAEMSVVCPLNRAVAGNSGVNQDVSGNEVSFLLSEEARLQFELEQAVCENWFGQLIEPGRPLTAFSSIPLLLLQGEYNPDLPAAFFRQQLSQMENATVIELPNTGGNIDWADPCVARLLDGFIDAPVSPPDQSCVERIRPILFVMPGEEPQP